MLKNIYRNILLFLISPCRISLTWVPWVVCVGGFFLSMLLYYPGSPVMLMLHEARSGIYTDLHPAIMAATIRCMFHIFPDERSGLGCLFIIENLFFWTGLLLVLLSGRRFWENKNQKTIWMLAVPLILLFVIWVDIIILTTRFLSKDFFQLACLLLATGLLLNLPHKFFWRLLVGAFILFLLFYGTALRHNLVLALLPMLYWLSLTIMPSKKIIALLSAFFLWIAFFLTSHVVTYHILQAHHLYPLSERFYADIFVLNYFGKYYENPPNGFLNTFDDIDEEFFRKNYLYQYMYIPHAFRIIAADKGRPFSLVKEGEPILTHETIHTEERRHGLTISEIEDFAGDYVVLRNVWIRRIIQEPFTYVSIRTYLVFRFFFVCTPPAFLFITGGFLNGVSILIMSMMILILHFKQRHTSPYVILSLCVLLNGLPLFIFLPADGPGNIRYLYWFYAAAFIAIVQFCSQSKVFQDVVASIHQYLERQVP